MAKLTMLFATDGSVDVVVPNGVSFETAESKINEMLAAMGREGAPIRKTQEPEQHRHDPETTGATTSAHAH